MVMNVFAKSDEIPLLPVQDIKEKPNVVDKQIKNYKGQ